ncbi:MAG: heavy-metal-associated domain-containing protein [candidate division Zixibacteria bacterium]|nr:heavy-metal-associated domain-containing protein [candidate division Zixibacteria bacterium]
MDAKKVSILSALAASSCCVPPLILLGLTMIGVGTAGFAGFSTTLGSFKWYILPLAIVGVGTSYYLYFKEKRKCSSTACKMVNEKFTKTMLVVSTVVVFGFLSWSVYPYVLDVEKIDVSQTPITTHYAVYNIDGMTCGGCEIAIDGSIMATGLVDSAKSSFVDGKAYVWYGGEKLDTATIQEALKSVGYNGVLIENN